VASLTVLGDFAREQLPLQLPGCFLQLCGTGGE